MCSKIKVCAKTIIRSILKKWAVAKCAHHTRQKKRLTKPFDYKQKAKIKKIQGRNSPYNEFLLF